MLPGRPSSIIGEEKYWFWYTLRAMGQIANKETRSSSSARTMTPATEYLLEHILSRLTEAYRPDQVILFGSHAWGAPDQGSDLDLMIVKST